MRCTPVVAVVLMLSPGAALAQEVVSPPVNASLQGNPVKRLLADGFEVKTGFSDNSGGAYMVLQKATSAYLCHSNPTATCEKLN